MTQTKVPRRPLPKQQQPYVPEYVRWNKQPILMDRTGRVVEPQSGSSQRAAHIPNEMRHPQEQSRVGVTDRMRQNSEPYVDPYGTWPNNLQRPLPRPQQIPYSNGGEEHLWTMNGEAISEDETLAIDADKYVVPQQTFRPSDVDDNKHEGFAPAGIPPSQDGLDDASYGGMDEPRLDDQHPEQSSNSNGFVSPGEYLLLVKNKVVARGNIEYINGVVSDIIYDRHPDFKGISLDPDDFVVLKRMRIRVGVSIE